MPRSTSALGALVLVSAIAGLSALAVAQSPAGPQKGATGATPYLQWPVILPQSQAADPTGWTKDEIETARSRCNALLAGIEYVAVPSEPLKEGSCGTPAGVELISIGRNPQVSLSAPAVVTCEMVAALDKWLKSDLQPAAHENLGSPIIRLEVMSAYSCRNAYGRKKSRLSEHGRANALDIRSFITQRGDAVEVLNDWGQTERDQKAQIAAAAAAARNEQARGEAIKRDAEKAQAAIDAKSKAAPAATAAQNQTSPPPPIAAPIANQPDLRGTVADAPGSASDVKVHIPGRRFSPALGLTQPSQLGGPKSNTAKTASQSAPAAASSARQRFLRRIHASACRTFGTTLGPEANEAHRNHFHVDMAERQTGGYCE